MVLEGDTAHPHHLTDAVMHVPMVGPSIQRQLWFGLGHSFCGPCVRSARQASSSACHPYPFPSSANPTPHEIFHLPLNASQEDIKARHIDLVKLYHPDAHFAKRASPAVRNSRFRAITHAYAVLRGRNGLDGVGVASDRYTHDDVMRAELRRRRRRSPAESNAPSHHQDDVRLTYIPFAIVLVGVVSALTLGSSHMETVERRTKSAAANLAEARAGAGEYGMERRRVIREQVRKMRPEGDVEPSESRQAMDKAPRELSNTETGTVRKITS